MTAEAEAATNGTTRGLLGAVLAAIVAVQALWMGRAIWGLNLILILAYLVWAAQPDLDASLRERVRPVFLAGIAVQALHFGEELWFGFAAFLPGYFGYSWSSVQFASFNVLWLAAFLLAAFGFGRGIPATTLVVWFFALVSLGNGVLHVGAALTRGEYVPGVVTAPFLFGIGVLLVKRLTARGQASAEAG